MPDAFVPPTLRERQPGKVANTGITNEIVRAVKGLSGVLDQGAQDPNGRSVLVVWAKITSNVGGQIGRYNGKTYTGLRVDANASGAVQEANLGDAAPEENCIIWHIPEIKFQGQKHALMLDVSYLCRFAGHNSKGKPVLLLGYLAIGDIAAPVTMPGSGGATANTTSWRRDGTALQFDFVTRVFLDTTAHKLLQFQRTVTVDACGNIVNVGTEHMSEIDTTIACST